VSDDGVVADGRDHQLDPRVIPLQRIGGAIFAAVLAAGSFVALGISVLRSDDPAWQQIAKAVLWLTLVLLAAWHSQRWPPIAYRHTAYRVDDQGIEIRKGVYWRVVINVPRSRVQHIDVSQGPIERRYELGTLVIYTAGTDHAKVELEGLAHDRALRIREHLLRTTTQTTPGGGPECASGASDAV
jgi:membrane protein YdbS with pleckstrin-like domain